MSQTRGAEEGGKCGWGGLELLLGLGLGVADLEGILGGIATFLQWSVETSWVSLTGRVCSHR